MAGSLQTPIAGLARRLLQRRLLGETEVREVLAQADGLGQPLSQTLLAKATIDSEALSQVLAEAYYLPWLDLDAYAFEQCPAGVIEIKLLRRHQVLPLKRRAQRLAVAVADPGAEVALKELQFHCGLSIDPIVVAADKLHRAVKDFVQQHDLSQYRVSASDVLELEPAAPVPAVHQSTEADEDDERPLVRFVNKLLLDALNARASDIHLEPYEHSYRARFRIDGLLHEASRPPLPVAGRIASRLKIMAQMNIAERRLPQDGRIRIRISGARAVDIRISTLPTLWGEKLVLRILDPGAAGFSIDTLGFTAEQRQQYLQCLQRQQGLILVTGPTGSGKTASLYAGLRVLNSRERNIATAEDPVEMPLDGINQVAVNHRVGLGFPEILRAFLRQDPDVLMIGEIRDLETADIAIKAAQTGHLVLSTLHTNSAAETINRLLNMGVARYNVASALQLIMAQRLLRRLCNHCKQPQQLPEALLRSLDATSSSAAPRQIFRAIGCKYCRGGYRGRVAIYEVVPISAQLSRLIIAGPESEIFADRVRKLQIAGLRQAALTKVGLGVTSLDEANRLT